MRLSIALPDELPFFKDGKDSNLLPIDDVREPCFCNSIQFVITTALRSSVILLPGLLKISVVPVFLLRKHFQQMLFICLVDEPGVEPAQAVLQTPALPLELFILFLLV